VQGQNPMLPVLTITSINRQQMRFLIFLNLLFVIVSITYAKPYTPADDTDMLSFISIKQTQLTNKLAQLSDDISNSNELALSYIKQAKTTSDPRYYGLAEAIIEPVWQAIKSNKKTSLTSEQLINLLLIKANILEFNHKFDESLIILNQLISSHNNAQALLMRANIHQIMGNYHLIAKDCAGLIIQASPLISAGCYFSVKGFTSSPNNTKQLIKKMQKFSLKQKNDSLAVKLWLSGLMAEAASLNNNWQLAEEIITTALKKKSNNIYLLSLYSDLLLKQNRYQDCIDLLSQHVLKISLLVRLLTAEIRLNNTLNHTNEQVDLEIRIKEDAIKADEKHLREYAYYQLYVSHNYSKALKNALINWQNQKEIIDSFILYQAAKIMRRDDITKRLESWREKNNIQFNYKKQSLSIIGTI
jgi:hypothetical protein